MDLRLKNGTSVSREEGLRIYRSLQALGSRGEVVALVMLRERINIGSNMYVEDHETLARHGLIDDSGNVSETVQNVVLACYTNSNPNDFLVSWPFVDIDESATAEQ